ncbi:MAG: HAD-IA family hydrolase [Bacteroidales bacterium]|jgi:putative hydrolase of the HAD superfamily|nr:HAD-IA family hydrolase [Bacteroidales bacterium]
MIKNIIFDLGGVIYNIRYENIAEAFARMGAENLISLYSKAQQTDFIDKFEEGLISTTEFCEEIRRLSKVPLTDAQIEEAWNAILIDVPAPRVDFLLKLKEKYKLYLFSNTNQFNYDCFTAHLRQKYGFDFFGTIFKAAYFSHTLHLRKPKEEGFRRIIQEQQLNPAETLFIDDSPQHIEGARRCGLNAYHLKDGEIIEEMEWL